MFRRWEPIVHLNGGTLAMREAMYKYLPKAEGEEDDIYYNRLTKSVLFGAYSRTVKTLSAMPFMTPMTITDLPESLEYLLKDCSGEGETLAAFAKTLVEDLLNFGKCHFLVEYPEVDEDLNAAQELELNIRPYFSRVHPMKLIGWKYSKVGSQKILDEIRVFEDVVEETDDWEEKHLQQVHVIRPGLVSIYENDVEGKKPQGGKPKAEYKLKEERVTSTEKLMLVTVYANKTGYQEAAPCLEELAWLNILHFQKTSDLDNIEHVCNVPMSYALGLTPEEMDKVRFSPHTMLKTGRGPSEVEFGFLEHSGNAIPASQASIKDLEARMLAMGAEALTPRGTSTRETGVAKTLDNTKATSILQQLVEALERGIEEGFSYAGEWMDVDASQTKVNIGDKISLTTDANIAAHLIGLAQNGNMSMEDLGENFKSKKFILESTELKEGQPPQETQQNIEE
ncbi:MAG: putative portal protein [Prokaryotic dsDNA virus sp.]|nr:MAG: putative portal protein [Prokaryotic dsDNA virus sp.]